MSAIVPHTASSSELRCRISLAVWWPVLAGFLVLYLPTYFDLGQISWDDDPNVYSLIVLAVALWILWQKRQAFQTSHTTANPLAGSSLLLAGLISYVFGRSLGIQLLEAGSQLPVAAGILLLFFGRPLLQRLWFPIFFLIFTVPLPGFIVNELTGVLKEHVSASVESLLYAMGYPIARNGVILTIGPYQLLVANACSGLNSIFTLSAMGVLYIYLSAHSRLIRNIVLLAAILPVALAANIVRVTALLLITYYLGNDAGQGFLHDFASIVLFSSALLLLLLLDVALGALLPHRSILETRP